jgi:putative membrane protein
MMDDGLLAVAHHVLVFGLTIMLAMQLALVRDGVREAELARVGRIDAGYGLTAGLILVVGLLRVWYGAKGVDYYTDNPWFWAKMAAFAGVGLLSIPPTLAFIRWRRALKADASALPTAAAVAGVRRLLRLEVVLLLLVPVFAALMARHQG